MVSDADYTYIDLSGFRYFIKFSCDRDPKPRMSDTTLTENDAKQLGSA